MCKRIKRNFRKKGIHMTNKHVLRLLNVTNQGTTKDNHSLIQLYSNRLTKNFFVM